MRLGLGFSLDFQTFNLSNIQNFKLSVFQIFKPSHVKIQTFKNGSKFQTLIFQSLKTNHTFTRSSVPCRHISNFKLSNCQKKFKSLKLEPGIGARFSNFRLSNYRRMFFKFESLKCWVLRTSRDSNLQTFKLSARV